MELRRIFDKALGRTRLIEINNAPTSNISQPKNLITTNENESVKKWQFKIHYVKGHGHISAGSHLENQLSEIGNSGWEIASMCLITPPPNECYMIIFQKQKV
jgi:hypothetical protein